MTDAASAPADGTGRYAWPACSRFLADLPALGLPFAGRRVVDLGCGAGGAGFAALDAGAAAVVFADADPAALAAVADRLARRPDRDRAIVAEHVWGAPLPGPRADIILAADVLYRPPFFADLLASIADGLAADGFAALSDPRSALEAELPRLAAARGLSWMAERRPTAYTLIRCRHAATDRAA